MYCVTIKLTLMMIVVDNACVVYTAWTGITNKIILNTFEHDLESENNICNTETYRCVLRIEVAKRAQNSSSHIGLLTFWHQLCQAKIRYLRIIEYAV